MGAGTLLRRFVSNPNQGTTREASLGCSGLSGQGEGKWLKLRQSATHHKTGLRRAGAALSHRRSGACSLSRATDGIAFLPVAARGF